MGKILALDYGDKRTGLAISDDQQLWAFGRGVVSGRPDVLLNEIEKLVQAEAVDRIVVGLPVSLKQRGSTGVQAKRVKAFVEQLKNRFHLPVDLEEERLTSVLGRRLNRQAGKRNPSDDEAAARLILEGYLEHHRHD